MTEIKNCQNQVVPAYSGITINITSPVLNASPLQCQTSEANYNTAKVNTPPERNTQTYSEYRESKYVSEPDFKLEPNGYYSKAEIAQNIYNEANDRTKNEHNNPQAVHYAENTSPNTNNNIYLTQISQNETSEEKPFSEADKSLSQTVEITKAPAETAPQNTNLNAAPYPSSYYINNFNNEYSSPFQQALNQHANNPDTGNAKDTNAEIIYPAYNQNAYENPNPANTRYNNDEQENLSVSREIIQNIDEKNQEEKELRKNGTKTKVVALTNEYIMSLENYLNNPNVDIRLMAAKDILTRLDEDRNRYDDAALNALLNKMLQDPAKLVRIAALSALSSDLASGNDYTVELLNKIQQRGDSDQQDVLEAAQIMLNRSATTEIRYIPAPENNINSTESIENEHVNRNKE